LTGCRVPGAWWLQLAGYGEFTGCLHEDVPGWARIGVGQHARAMYLKQLHRSGHTRRFEIRQSNGWWEILSAADDRIVRQARYDDWHRVERARLAFALEISQLEDAGWVVH